MRLKVSSSITALFLALHAWPKDMPLAPDIVIINASRSTRNGTRPPNGRSACCFPGDRIVAVGTSDEIRSLAGPKTRLVDAEKRTVVPGFNDSHVHFLMGGFSLANVDLRDAKSPEEMATRLSGYTQKAAEGPLDTWGRLGPRKMARRATARQTDDRRGNPGQSSLPSTASMDTWRCANSLALKLAGVTGETKDPPGGVVVRDAGRANQLA